MSPTGFSLAPVFILAYTESLPELTSLDVSPTAYVENTDEAFGWIMAYLTQDPDARKQMHHFQLSSADRQANKKAKNAVESKMEKSASWRTLQVIAKVQRTYGELRGKRRQVELLTPPSDRQAHPDQA